MLKKQLLIISTVMVLSMTMLIGCTNQKETSPPTTNQPTTAEVSTTTEAPTTEPEPTEIPIVKTIGSVDNTLLSKVEFSFEDIVKKMRSDGLVSATDICVVMDSTSINVDITFENEKTDIVLYKDEDTDIYTLTLDYDFVWLEGLCSPINGIDPTPYNKDLLIALLSIVSNEPQTLFETIDLTYFSCYSLSDTEWTEVGDCYMMDGDFSADNYISYKIKK